MIESLLKVGFGLVVAGVAYLRWRRMQRALVEPMSAAECALCGSRTVTATGLSAYRCDECGHEGGDGLGEVKRIAREQKLRALSPEERFTRGCEALVEARDLLTAAGGTFERGAIRTSELSEMTAYHTCVQQMRQAQECVRDARVLLDAESLRLAEREIRDLGLEKPALRIDLDLAEVPVGDLAGMLRDKTPERVAVTRGQATAMLAAVKETLHRLEVPDRGPIAPGQ